MWRDVPDLPSKVRKATVPPEWSALLDTLRPYERKIVEAVARLVEQLRSKVDLDLLEAAIERGRYDQALWSTLGMDGPADMTAFAPLRKVLVTLVHDTGEKALDGGLLSALPSTKPLVRLGTAFDRLNSATVAYLNAEAGARIKAISDATLAGLRAVLLDGVKAGDHPRVIARSMRDSIGLTERDALAVARYRANLINRSAAAKRGLRDRRYDGIVSRVRRKPATMEMIDRAVERKSAMMLKARAETIARTEAARALNVGQMTAWRQMAADRGIPGSAIRRFWTVAHDERTCDFCNGVVDKNAKGVTLDQPFDTDFGPIDTPPLHPNCRCVLRMEMDVAAAIAAVPNDDETVKMLKEFLLAA